MRLRGATTRDIRSIDKLVHDYDFVLDVAHIQSIVVIEDDDGTIIAAGSLVTILEGMFVVDKDESRKKRVECLRLLMKQADTEVSRIGYSSYHVFATNDNILKVLVKKFGFVKSIGTTLLRWI